MAPETPQPIAFANVVVFRHQTVCLRFIFTSLVPQHQILSLQSPRPHPRIVLFRHRQFPPKNLTSKHQTYLASRSLRPPLMSSTLPICPHQTRKMMKPITFPIPSFKMSSQNSTSATLVSNIFNMPRGWSRRGSAVPTRFETAEEPIRSYKTSQSPRWLLIRLSYMHGVCNGVLKNNVLMLILSKRRVIER